MHPRYGRRLPLTHDQGLLTARASYVVPSVTIVLAMLLHGVAGPRAVPFFISEADYTGLDGLVFTVGLTLGGLVQMTYAWHLYHTLEVQRPRLWFVATLSACLHPSTRYWSAILTCTSTSTRTSSRPCWPLVAVCSGRSWPTRRSATEQRLKENACG